MPSGFVQDLFCLHCQRIFRVPALAASADDNHTWLVACPTCSRKADVQVLANGRVQVPPNVQAKADPSIGQFLPYPLPVTRDPLMVSTLTFGLLVTLLLGFAAWAMHVQPWLCPFAFCTVTLLFLVYVVFVLTLARVLSEKTAGAVFEKVGQYLSYSFGTPPPRGTIGS